MLTIRRGNDRGHVNMGWLDSHHSFSFGHYHDPNFMGFGPLRVINEDRVSPGGGFAPHGHANMEIISYVLSGGLAHKDSLGTGATIVPGEVQRMSAGTGIRHSEFNASEADPVHFLQIWLLPDTQNVAPSYEQKAFDDERNGRLRLVASKTGRDGSLKIHQDTDLFASVLQDGDAVEHSFAAGRRGWLQVARGTVTVNGETLEAGDGAAMAELETVTLTANGEAEFLLFDLPPAH
ncbi:MAG: pirin family protein [Pseudomonadota bacterium]